jgi:Ca-activated chloride channel family protein
MIDFSQFQFLYPGYLLLLPIIWWLLRIFSRHTRRHSMWNKLCDPGLLHKMIVNNNSRDEGQLMIWTLVVILSLAAVAAAGPSWRKQSHPIMESSSARVLAIDLSASMLVSDIKPNRFEHAVTVAREILGAEFDGETGLVVFAGAAFVVSPLTKDAETLLAFLDALDPSTMPLDGTRIDLAIISADLLLQASLADNGQILIVTAGDSRGGQAVSAALNAADNGHRVSVFAVGSPTGGPLQDSKGRLKLDANGKFVLSRSNFELLERIVQIGNGTMVTMKQYQGYANPLVSRLAAGELIQSENKNGESQRAAANDGAWLVLLMLPFTLLLFRKNLIWMMLLVLLLPNDHELYAGDWDSFWNHPEKLAFDAYLKGDYQSSYELSSNSQLRGSAFYRSGQFESALELFNDDASANSMYNRGNALAQQKMFPEAVVAYQKALDLNPDLAVARYNKRMLELFLEQQLETENQASGGADGLAPSADNMEQADGEARIGVIGEEQTNPADDPQPGPGIGASLLSGQVDPVEHFDGQEQEMDRFVLRAQGDQQQIGRAHV